MLWRLGCVPRVLTIDWRERVHEVRAKHWPEIFGYQLPKPKNGLPKAKAAPPKEQTFNGGFLALQIKPGHSANWTGFEEETQEMRRNSILAEILRRGKKEDV